ncbi:MAG: nitroreductase family protein [Gaiellaceae bacterium]
MPQRRACREAQQPPAVCGAPRADPPGDAARSGDRGAAQRPGSRRGRGLSRRARGAHSRGVRHHASARSKCSCGHVAALSSRSVWGRPLSTGALRLRLRGRRARAGALPLRSVPPRPGACRRARQRERAAARGRAHVGLSRDRCGLCCPLRDQRDVLAHPLQIGLRGYRFALLEAGHLAQNLLLTGTALELACIPLGGFFDRRMDDLLDLDGVNESMLYAVAVGRPAE